MVSMIPPTPSPGKKIKASDMFFPSKLSLPHIRRVSIRNIYAKSMGELLSSMPPGSIRDWKSIALNDFDWYFELHEESKPTLLYRSDYASNTLNPEWEMPSEFAKENFASIAKYDSQCIVGGAQTKIEAAASQMKWQVLNTLKHAISKKILYLKKQLI